MYVQSKEVNVILRRLYNSGWKFIGKKNHLKIRSPAGKLFIIATSPSDPNAHKAVKKKIDDYEKSLVAINKLN